MFLPLHDKNPIRHLSFPYVTYGLIALNVLVFLVQLTHQPEAQFNEFAITFSAIPPTAWLGAVIDRIPGLPDEVTLVTYAFLHADWLHLLSNMLFLWVFGDNIEDALGHVKFLAFYLLCAVLAALVYFAFAANGWLIGASGAVAGVMGAYIVLYPHARVYVLFRLVIPIPLPIPALWMLGVWVATQVFYLVIGDASPVAWWAHLGGVVAGALLCIPMRRQGVQLFGGR
ncbi:rhomboid family intramembrane serine protease [Devosia sp.]|jgi:membrane associated rhomboid family serine protease|uniref:rhomboid family intramembrane serine protease n=1 Tax=Devosia sp. TaxID=1871048 RepID=UPI0037BEE1E0